MIVCKVTLVNRTHECTTAVRKTSTCRF